MSLLLMFRPSEGVAEEVTTGDDLTYQPVSFRSAVTIRFTGADGVTFKQAQRVRI